MPAKFFGVVMLAGSLYVILLAFPSPLFSYIERFHDITIYSDRPMSPNLRFVADSVRERLRKSPLNDGSLRHRIFICNSDWRFILFTNRDYHAAGVNQAWLNRNIFLRRSDTEHNRLIGPSGKAVPGERTLGYFMTHEIVHSLEVHFLGRWSYLQLSAWKREGYADYVAKDANFISAERLAALQRNAPEMNPRRSGLYLRHHLLVAYLLDVQKMDAGKMLRQPFSEALLERQVKEMR